MGLFSSTQPSIRVRVLPRFPALVNAGTGITITKSGNTYTFAAPPPTDLALSGLVDIPTDTLLGRDSAGIGSVELISASSGLGFDGSGSIGLVPNQRIRGIPLEITGSPITVASKKDIVVPFACTITQVTLLADQVGSAVIDIWRTSFASFPPTVANTITNPATKPTISAAQKGQTGALTGWTTAVAAGDILRINVDSVTSLTRLSVGISVVTV